MDWYWYWVIEKEVENISLSKVRDKLGKTVLEFSLKNIVKEILCSCNFLVLCVYDIVTDIKYRRSLFHNRKHEAKSVWLLISLYGSLQVWVCMSTYLLPIMSQSKRGDHRKYKKIKVKNKKLNKVIKDNQRIKYFR